MRAWEIECRTCSLTVSLKYGRTPLTRQIACQELIRQREPDPDLLSVGESAPWFRYRSTQFVCSIDPFLNDLLGIRKGLLMTIAVSHAAWKFWDLSNERIVLCAPEDDDFVLRIHDQSSKVRLYLRITPRTCFTWYGLPLLFCGCRLRISSTWLLVKM